MLGGLTMAAHESLPMDAVTSVNSPSADHIGSAQASFIQNSTPKFADEANLGMVLDVELNVLLRFGQQKLSLREVLDLTTGSVIELDRRVDDPVELLLDGRVIARGEAAIVDGNYGMRVTEIVQPASSCLRS